MHDVLRYRFSLNPEMVSRALPPATPRVTAVRMSAAGDFACPCGQTVEETVVVQVGAILVEDWERDPVYHLGRCPECGMVLGDWVLPEPNSPPPFALDSCLPWAAYHTRDGMLDREATTPARKATAELWSRRFDGDGEV